MYGTSFYNSQLEQMLHKISDISKHAEVRYPPYNIRKVAENKYVIELALAGFDKKDISITIDGGVLKIEGVRGENETVDYLYRGIANRAFTRAFNLNPDVEIQNAYLINGMLKIWLEAIVPENKKPRSVEIKTEETDDWNSVR